MGKGMWDWGGGERRGPPSLLWALPAGSTLTRCSPAWERGRRFEDTSATRLETSHPQVRPGPLSRQEQRQVSPTSFLNRGPRDSLICERKEGPIPAELGAFAQRRDPTLHPLCGPKG